MSTIDWTSLQHAYGTATDIPGLLLRARAEPVSDDYRAEPWYSLWSALYHQDDIYSASYAAVPELIEIARARGDAGGIEALLLAASIELRRHESAAPPVPVVVEPRYREALEAAPAVADALAAASERPDDHRRLEIVNAVFTGDYPRARSLLDEDDEGE